MSTHIKYYWKHVPTNRTGISEFTLFASRPISKLTCLEAINAWNRQSQGEWVYWMD